MICTAYNNFPSNFNIFLHHCHTMLSSYCSNILLLTFFRAFYNTLSHFYNAENCFLTLYPFTSAFIVELTERSPIIVQNSSNPSSRKFGCTTVRPYKVLLLACVGNCAAGTPTPRLCPVVQ